MIVPPPEYLSMVRDICDKYGVMLIVDEVICGVGRSGKRFGHQNFGVKPDVVTMAKGLTSAYSPLSATAVRADMYESFMEKEATSHFRHINTFAGNPVSCAVGLENMNILEREDLVQRSASLGEGLRKRLEVLSAHPNVGEIRYFGSTCGIEMVEDRTTKVPAAAEKVLKIIQLCKQKGLLIGRNGDTVPGFANVLTLAPPFVTTDGELDFIAEVLQQAFAEL
jgi:adenosylmethionine-8-amino-7-oxononanoate aminotransferase